MAAGAQIAVDDSAAVALAASAEMDGSFAVISNAGANSVFLGGEDVTDSNGYELAADTSLPNVLPLDHAETLFAICAAGETATVHVLVA